MTKKSSIQLFKNLVNSNRNGGTISSALKNAFSIEKTESINWFVELSENEKSHWFYVQDTLFELLPQIAKENKKASVRIFNNLLKPEFHEMEGLFPSMPPQRYLKNNSHDLWIANEKILSLLNVAPKEFCNAVLELALQYQQIPLRRKSKKIHDVLSVLWYHPDSYQYAVKLLLSIENQSKMWAKKNDPRLKEIIEYLDTSPYSVSIRIQSNILSTNPKLFAKRLFNVTNKIIQSDDCIDLLPKILKNICKYLPKSQIRQLNRLMLNFRTPKNFLTYDGSYRRYLLEAIPKYYQDVQTQKWLIKNKKTHPKLQLRTRPTVFRSYEGEQKIVQEKKEFDKMNDLEQEKEITDLLNKIMQIKTKNEKLDFLKITDIYLNKEKPRINKSITTQLEPIIRNYCRDTDPEGSGYEEEKPMGNSLVSYPTVRAYAAASLLKLTWHSLSDENISIIKKLADDPHTFVREEVCRNLRYLSHVDYPLSLTLAKKFLEDNRRLHFFLTDFLHFNIRTHTKDIFEFCEKIVNRYGKLKMSDKDEEPSLDFVIDLIVQMALKLNDDSFTLLFSKLVEDDSYNYSVKHRVSFACKNENILFDEKLKTRILDVYYKLIQSSNNKVITDAEFFLLHSLISKGVSFLPEIKPLLLKLSNTKYELSTSDYYRLMIIDYTEKFWLEMPDEFVDYLYHIYSNNKDLTSNFHKSREVIKLLGEMYISGKISSDSKIKVMDILLEFVKVGWPEASFVLKHLEQSNMKY